MRNKKDIVQANQEVWITNFALTEGVTKVKVIGVTSSTIIWESETGFRNSSNPREWFLTYEEAASVVVAKITQQIKGLESNIKCLNRIKEQIVSELNLEIPKAFAKDINS